MSVPTPRKDALVGEEFAPPGKECTGVAEMFSALGKKFPQENVGDSIREP
jgi:hypothetical protein